MFYQRVNTGNQAWRRWVRLLIKIIYRKHVPSVSRTVVCPALYLHVSLTNTHSDRHTVFTSSSQTCGAVTSMFLLSDWRFAADGQSVISQSDRGRLIICLLVCLCWSIPPLRHPATPWHCSHAATAREKTSARRSAVIIVCTQGRRENFRNDGCLCSVVWSSRFWNAVWPMAQRRYEAGRVRRYRWGRVHVWHAWMLWACECGPLRRDPSAPYAQREPVARSIGPTSSRHQIKTPEDRLSLDDKAVWTILLYFTTIDLLPPPPRTRPCQWVRLILFHHAANGF